MAKYRAIYRDPTRGWFAGSGVDDVIEAGAFEAIGVLDGADKVAFFANGGVIRDLADPIQASDAVTKAYVDAMTTGFHIKEPVRVATVAALDGSYSNTNKGTLSGMPNILDGINLAIGDRILVKDMAGNPNSAANNGIYVITTLGTGANGVWVRSEDANENGELVSGTSIHVREGTANANSTWVLTDPDTPITIGVTNVTFTQFSSAGDITAGAGLVRNGNEFSIGQGDGILVGTNSISVRAGNGLEFSGGVLTIKRPASSGLSLGATGLAVSGGNGITVGTSVTANIDSTAGGMAFNSGKIAVKAGAAIAVGSDVSVKVAADGGIQVASDSLALKLNNTASGGYTGSGLETSADGVRAAIVTTNPALRMVSNRLDVKYDTARGLGSDANGLHIKAATDSLSFTSGTLGVRVNTAKGIKLDTGLAVNIAETGTARTLTFTGGTLGVMLGSGLTGSASGLAVKHDATLAVGAEGLSVRGIATSGGAWTIDGTTTNTSALDLNRLINSNYIFGFEEYHSHYASEAIAYHPESVYHLEAGEAIAQKDIVCMGVSDGRAYVADAGNDDLSNVIGVCVQGGSPGEKIGVVVSGPVDPGFFSLSPGETGFLGTNGSVDTSWPASGRIVRLGFMGTNAFHLAISDFGKA